VSSVGYCNTWMLATRASAALQAMTCRDTKLRWVRHVARLRRRGIHTEFGAGVRSENVQLEDQKKRCNTDLRERGCEDRGWIELAHDRVQCQAVLNLRFMLPQSVCVS